MDIYTNNNNNGSLESRYRPRDFGWLGGMGTLAVESWGEARANRIRNEWSTWVLVRGGLHASY